MADGAADTPISDPSKQSDSMNALQAALAGVSTAEPKPPTPSNITAPTDDNTAVPPNVPESETTAAVAANKEIEVAATSELSPTEQAMRDLLKPMIKSWLDENMPRMVEEVLRQEVEATRKSGE